MARYLIVGYNVMVMDRGYRLLAAKYIRRQAKQLAEQLDGVRTAADIEFVHRARVATRRLRAALRMFAACFDSKQTAHWRKIIRRTTAKLGAARDCDVQIEYLCGILAELHARDCFPGIAQILMQLERQRERMQRKVVKAIDRLERSRVLRQMRRTTKRILHDCGSTRAQPTSESARRRVIKHISRQLGELLSHQDSLADTSDRDGHHAMRIAAKRLRYTLEISRPIFPDILDSAVEAVKQVQTLLGEVHDCDVWAEHLDAFVAKQRKRLTKAFGHAGRLARLQAGIDYLRENRLRRRNEVFCRLVEYWAELGRQNFWAVLLEAVSKRSMLSSTDRNAVNGALTSADQPPQAVGSIVLSAETPVAPRAEAVFESRPAPCSAEPSLRLDAAAARLPTPKPLLTAGS